MPLSLSDLAVGDLIDVLVEHNRGLVQPRRLHHEGQVVPSRAPLDERPAVRRRLLPGEHRSERLARAVRPVHEDGPLERDALLLELLGVAQLRPDVDLQLRHHFLRVDDVLRRDPGQVDELGHRLAVERLAAIHRVGLQLFLDQPEDALDLRRVLLRSGGGDAEQRPVLGVVLLERREGHVGEGGQLEVAPRNLLGLADVRGNVDQLRGIGTEETHRSLVGDRTEQTLERVPHAVRAIPRSIVEDLDEVRLGLHLDFLLLQEADCTLDRHRRRDDQLVSRVSDVVVVVQLAAEFGKVAENVLLRLLLCPLVVGVVLGSHPGLPPFPCRRTYVQRGAY